MAGDKRISAVLQKNPILAGLCMQYLETTDKISKYNAEVLAEKDSEWTPGKLITKARDIASPSEGEGNKDFQTALDEYERLQNEANQARRNVLEMTAKEIGVTLSATAERNPETESALKEDRKVAMLIGNQLKTLASLTVNKTDTDAVNEFLAGNELPNVGRDQSTNFSENSESTVKHRVDIKVYKDDEEVLNVAGFTKLALSLGKFYERGKSPKADVFRAYWENVLKENANATEASFEDNGLIYVITKRQ